MRLVKNTGLQCAAGVPELFPAAFPSLKTWNATDSPLSVFGESLNYWLHLYLVLM